MEPRSAREVSAAVEEAGWRVLLQTVQASFETGSLAAGLAFAARIGVAADAANHHPDLTITYPRVHVRLTTHDAGGLTDRDVDLARTISAIADELGLVADPTRLAVVEVAVDAVDVAAVRPFWRAVLGHAPDGDDDQVVDPDGRAPTVWFQRADGPRPERNTIHVDVYVPPEQAPARVAAAVAAGGRLLDEAAAPAWWVLADPEGNEACVCTWLPRTDAPPGEPPSGEPGSGPGGEAR